MSVPRAKKSKQKIYTITEAKMHRLLEDVRLDMLQQSMILFGAYMMEEPEIDCNEERLIALWQGIERYSEYIDDHLITLGKVCDIINEHTGMSISWHKKPLEVE